MPIGYRPIPSSSSGAVHCIEFYEYIKDKLLLLEKWSHALHDKPFGWSNSDLYIDAKLYGCRDGELIASWVLYKLYPTLFPTIKFEDQVDLQFSFVSSNTLTLSNNSQSRSKTAMYDIGKYIKEYKDRDNKCEFCAYYPMIQGGRCYMCENHNWFVQEINLRQYVINRVTEDSAKEFQNSEKAVSLKREIELRKNVYDDFNKYVEKQKEILDNELELKRKEWSELANGYALEMKRYSCNNVDKALASLDSIMG